MTEQKDDYRTFSEAEYEQRKTQRGEQDMTDFLDGLDRQDSDRLELARLRKFVRRLGYLRPYMAAGDIAYLDALTDDRHARVLAALDAL